MRFIACATTASAVALLAACSNPMAASDSNFARVINHHYANQCIEVIPDERYLRGEKVDHYPITLTQATRDSLFMGDAKTMNARQNADFDALVGAGLVTMKKGTRMKKRKHFNGQTEKVKVPTRVYSLTATGKRALSPDATDVPTFCAGKLRVAKIIRFTKPSDKKTSMMVSGVVYTVKPVDVPKWAHSGALKKRFSAAYQVANSHSIKQHIVLLQSNKGWVPAEDFSDS